MRIPVGPMMEGLSVTKQIAAISIAVRALLVLSIALTLDGILLGPLPVHGQEITDAFVRGTDVALRSEPAANADLVTTLQLGDAIRITGDAETESGETKPVTVDTLGVTRVWFVPVEVVESGDAGWIAEVFIDPHRLNETDPAAQPAPENTPNATVVPVPTPTQVPTATPTATATPVPTAIPTPTATEPTQPQGAVDRATAWNVATVCDDGIGRTFTDQESESVGFTDDDFSNDVKACIGSMFAPMFYAQCSPPLESAQPEEALVVCVVSVFNFGQRKDIEAGADDFSLLSNTDSYEVNIDVSQQVAPPEFRIPSQPAPVPEGEYVLRVVAFDVPEEVAKEDMVLQWTGAGPAETTRGELPGLQVLVQAREPALAEAVTSTQSEPRSDSQGAQASVGGQSYTGTSDDVIGPLDLVPGLYQVSARYTGDENFVIWVRLGDGTSDLLVNDIGSYSGESTFSVETSTQVVIEVEGIGPWEVRIEKLM
jgi:hypothetical protein